MIAFELGWGDREPFEIGTFVMHADGTAVRPLEGVEGGVAWSPDGSKIAYQRGCPDPNRQGAVVVVRDLASGAERELDATAVETKYEGDVSPLPPGETAGCFGGWISEGPDDRAWDYEGWSCVARWPQPRDAGTERDSTACRRRRDWPGHGAAVGSRLGAELAARPASRIRNDSDVRLTSNLEGCCHASDIQDPGRARSGCDLPDGLQPAVERPDCRHGSDFGVGSRDGGHLRPPDVGPARAVRCRGSPGAGAAGRVHRNSCLRPAGPIRDAGDPETWATMGWS